MYYSGSFKDHILEEGPEKKDHILSAPGMALSGRELGTPRSEQENWLAAEQSLLRPAPKSLGLGHRPIKGLPGSRCGSMRRGYSRVLFHVYIYIYTHRFLVQNTMKGMGVGTRNCQQPLNILCVDPLGMWCLTHGHAASAFLRCIGLPQVQA